MFDLSNFPHIFIISICAHFKIRNVLTVLRPYINTTSLGINIGLYFYMHTSISMLPKTLNILLDYLLPPIYIYILYSSKLASLCHVTLFSINSFFSYFMLKLSIQCLFLSFDNNTNTLWRDEITWFNVQS